MTFLGAICHETKSTFLKQCNKQNFVCLSWPIQEKNSPHLRPKIKIQGHPNTFFYKRNVQDEMVSFTQWRKINASGAAPGDLFSWNKSIIVNPNKLLVITSRIGFSQSSVCSLHLCQLLPPAPTRRAWPCLSSPPPLHLSLYSRLVPGSSGSRQLPALLSGTRNIS
jgi:hypothetical protein